MKLVDSYTFTRLNDLRLCKQCIIGEGWGKVFVTDDPHIGTCCGKGSLDGRTLLPKMVKTIYFSRIRGIETCDECIAIEQKFVDKLFAFDETVEFEFDGGEAINEVREQNKAFEGMKKAAMTRDQKRRILLEAAGQGRLF